MFVLNKVVIAVVLSLFPFVDAYSEDRVVFLGDIKWVKLHANSRSLEPILPVTGVCAYEETLFSVNRYLEPVDIDNSAREVLTGRFLGSECETAFKYRESELLVVARKSTEGWIAEYIGLVDELDDGEKVLVSQKGYVNTNYPFFDLVKNLHMPLWEGDDPEFKVDASDPFTVTDYFKVDKGRTYYTKGVYLSDIVRKLKIKK